jgi:hypothetical protein
MAPPRATWRMEINAPQGQRHDNTLPPGALWKAFRAVQKGELRAALTSGGSGPYYALICVADLSFLETGTGTRAVRPTSVVDVPRKANGPRTPPAEAAIVGTLERAGRLAMGSKVRVALTLAGEPIAGVVLLDDLAALEVPATEGAA